MELAASAWPAHHPLLRQSGELTTSGRIDDVLLEARVVEFVEDVASRLDEKPDLIHTGTRNHAVASPRERKGGRARGADRAIFAEVERPAPRAALNCPAPPARARPGTCVDSWLLRVKMSGAEVPHGPVGSTAVGASSGAPARCSAARARARVECGNSALGRTLCLIPLLIHFRILNLRRIVTLYATPSPSTVQRAERGR